MLRPWTHCRQLLATVVWPARLRSAASYRAVWTLQAPPPPHTHRRSQQSCPWSLLRSPQQAVSVNMSTATEGAQFLSSETGCYCHWTDSSPASPPRHPQCNAFGTERATFLGSLPPHQAVPTPRAAATPSSLAQRQARVLVLHHSLSPFLSYVPSRPAPASTARARAVGKSSSTWQENFLVLLEKRHAKSDRTGH